MLMLQDRYVYTRISIQLYISYALYNFTVVCTRSLNTIHKCEYKYMHKRIHKFINAILYSISHIFFPLSLVTFTIFLCIGGPGWVE